MIRFIKSEVEALKNTARTRPTAPNLSFRTEQSGDPESMPAWATVPKNSCVLSISSMDSGSASMTGTTQVGDALQNRLF